MCKKMWPLFFCGRIDQILHKAESRCKAAAADSIGDMLPWTDIITACVDHQLAWLRYHKVSVHSLSLQLSFALSC